MYFEPSKVVALYIEVVYVALWKVKPRDPSASGGARVSISWTPNGVMDPKGPQ